ncbi:MAG: DUF2079 domain-containing protein [Candidatus Micrarchaeales archaeon]
MFELKNQSIYFWAVLALVIANFIYWSYFVIVKYTMFKYSYIDFGIYAYNFYYLLHYSNTMSFLQHFVIANHITIDQIIFAVPLFYLYQSPLMLLLFQVFVLSLTGVLVFFIASTLLKDRFTALVLSSVFLLNPGVQGLIVFDYHSEFLILPFYLLTFYFYFRRNKPFFFLSLALLLGTMDSVVFITLALGLGLIYYELFREKDKKISAERLKLALCIVAFSIIAFLLYSVTASKLTNSYPEAGLSFPPTFKVFQTDSSVLYKFLPSIIPGFNYSVTNTILLVFTHINVFSYPPFLIIALLVAIFVFGISAINDPPLLIILDLPWLVAFLGLGYGVYGSIDFQYFSYVIGGTLVATMLGVIEINEGRGLWSILSRISKQINKNKRTIICASALLLSFYVSAAGSLIHAKQTNVPFLLFDNSEFNASCYSQLNSAIAKLPENVSLMTESAISPHVIDRKYLEVTFYTESGDFNNYFFASEYILTDFNSCINSTQIDTPQQYAVFLNYTKHFNYSIYFSNGSAIVYRLNRKV